MIANLGLYFAVHTLFRSTRAVTAGPVTLDAPQRLDAESFRDTILAFSGKLNFDRPGRTFTVEPQGKRIVPKAEDSNYRSVYLSIVRNAEPEALTLFDFADPSIVVGHREETTVPSQSLYLLNSPFVQQNARAAAEQLVKDLAPLGR